MEAMSLAPYLLLVLKGGYVTTRLGCPSSLRFSQALSTAAQVCSHPGSDAAPIYGSITLIFRATPFMEAVLAFMVELLLNVQTLLAFALAVRILAVLSEYRRRNADAML